MKSISERLLTSYASHGDTEKFLSDCFNSAENIIQHGCDDALIFSTFSFADGSRIYYDVNDKYVRSFSPFQ